VSQPGGIAFDWGSPRTVQGYWWMGGIDVPVRLVRTVLTDRASGALWFLEYNSTAGVVGISQPAPSPLGPSSDRNVQVSPALDEPYIGPGCQVFVRTVSIGGQNPSSSVLVGVDFTPRPGQWGQVSDPPLYLRTTLPTTSMQGTPSQTVAWFKTPAAFNPLNPLAQPLAAYSVVPVP
jgi:hypothetical protein